MSVNTKGVIDKKYSPVDIQRAIKQKFGIESEFERTSFDDYIVLFFEYKDEKRQLSIFTNYKEQDSGKTVTLIDLNAWGASVELIRGIISLFGGYIKERDTSDDWQYVSADEEIVLSEEEQRQNKLLTKLSESGLDFVTKVKIVEYIDSNLDFIKSL